ncbi:hypothetical protein F8271_28395 [Micromonospora sp. ALFpr18c]|uniref:hypothetical protein n=1 Tax=unclassified Micromonospora TaxID=2617518 RepID=UPI00124B3B3C|nr:hypothetical protein [Micromonospora sp. ALFpr18c]KAB1929868.1 hypothetical protein F8271_28395 [Micromonospora sp. ALFpr18c]
MSGAGMNENLRGLASDALRRWPRLRVALRRADRQLTRQVTQLKGTVRTQAPKRLFRAALPAGPVIEARFVGVLDGHTLNLDLAVPAALAADVVGAELHLVRGATRLTAPADLRRAPAGLSVSAAVLLCGRPGGLDLAEGPPWRVECRLIRAPGGGDPVRVFGGVTERPAGPTVAAPPCPDSGHRYRPLTDQAGRLTLAVTAPGALAELTDVRLDWTGASLEVRTVGWRADGPVEVGLEPRGGGEFLRVRGEPVGPDLLRFALPLAPMTEAGYDRERIFDVRLHSGSRRLRVGTVLHDLANPKKSLRPPAAMVWAAPGRSVRVRPYFTPAGSLALACLPIRSRPTDGNS